MCFFRKMARYGVLLSVCLLATECRRNDYDMSDGVNMEITVGGDSLTIPLGLLKPVTLGSIIDEQSVDILEKSENGEYAIRLSDSVEVKIDSIVPVEFTIAPDEIAPVVQEMEPVEFEEIKIEPVTSEREAVEIPKVDLNELELPGISEYVKEQVSLGDYQVPDEVGGHEFAFESFEFDQGKYLDLNIHYDFSAQEELRRIERVDLAEATVTMTLRKGALNDVATELDDQLEYLLITFPEKYTLGNPGNGARIEDGHTLVVRNLPIGKEQDDFSVTFDIDHIDLSGVEQSDGIIDLTDQVHYEMHYVANGKAPISALGDEGNITLELDLHAEPKLADAQITLNDIDIEGRSDVEDFSQTVEGLPDQVDRLNTVYFQEGAQLELSVTDPGIAPLQFADEGLCVVELPQVFNFDANQYLQGNKLTIPVNDLFGTHTLAINSMTVDQQVVDGTISLEGSVTYDISGLQVKSTTGMLNTLQSITPQPISVKVQVGGLIVDDAEFTTKRIDFDMMDERIDIDIDEFVAEEAKMLYYVGLETPADISLKIAMEGVPDEIDSVYFDDAYLDFPDEFLFADGEADANNRVSLGRGFRVADDYALNLHLRGFDFGTDGKELTDGQFVYKAQVEMSGKAHINSTTLASDDMGDITVYPSIEIAPIRINNVIGRVEPAIDPVEENIELDLPDLLKNENNNLDIVDPVITFAVGNTLAIPVSVDLSLVPKLNGQVLADGIIQTTLDIAPAEVQGTPVVSKFWLAKTSESASDGYTPVALPNLANLLKTIPDEISVTAVPKVLGDRHEVTLSQEPNRIDLDYAVNVPLSFGEDFHLEYTDTIGGLSESLGDFLPYIKNLDVRIVVQNEIPLDLDLSLEALDDRGTPLEGVDLSADATIGACNADGSAKESRLNLTLKETEDGALAYLDALKLVVSATQDHTVAGMPLKDSQGLSLSLSVMLPEGLTLDLNELGNGEGE